MGDQKLLCKYHANFGKNATPIVPKETHTYATYFIP
jgi:hypothetical protein